MPRSIMAGIVGGAVKTLVYGPEGIGKSTFASKFPFPFFEDVEGSTKFMNVIRTSPSNWTLLLEDIKDFIKNQSGSDIRHAREHPTPPATVTINIASSPSADTIRLVIQKYMKSDTITATPARIHRLRWFIMVL